MFLGRKGAQKTGLNDGATLAAARVNPQLRWITVVIKYFPASARLPFFAINISTNIYRRFESYVSNREKCSSSSTPGPDHISWRHLKSLITNDRCLLKIVQIANACIDLEFWRLISTRWLYPNQTKTTTTPPNRSDPSFYSTPWKNSSRKPSAIGFNSTCQLTASSTLTNSGVFGNDPQLMREYTSLILSELAGSDSATQVFSPLISLNSSLPLTTNSSHYV